jgi:DNA repair ATPase RecN
VRVVVFARVHVSVKVFDDVGVGVGGGVSVRTSERV